MHTPIRRTLVAASAAAALLWPAGLTATTASAATSGVCGKIAHCRVVAHKDVDGDGRRDHVGWVQRSQDVVVIRVRTGDGDLLRRRVDVRFWWGGGAWAGAAAVDGRRGKELLVGSTMGAHTPGYTMLTYRRGRLVVEAPPDGYDHWYIDAAYSVYAGWWRRIDDNGRVKLVDKLALRDGAKRTFSGTNTTYVWRNGHWAEKRTLKRHYKNAKAASKIAGFHIRGLARFPGV